MHGGTGDNQVPHPCQAREGLPSGTQSKTQTGRFREAPGHEHGLCVVPEAQAVGNSGAQGDDILQCTAQLHPHHIGVDINTKPVGHKGILHQLSRRLVSAGGHTACGNPPGHLLSMAGPGQDRHGVARDLSGHLRHAQKGLRLNALGHRYQKALRVQMGCNGLAHPPERKGRRGQDHHVPSPD